MHETGTRTHWRALSSDPNAAAVRAELVGTLRSRRGPRIPDTEEFLRDFVQGHSTLDVGVVEHVASASASSHWKHRIVVENASRVLGVDILDEAVRELSSRGYNVRTCDATSDTDLGERFERIHVGDVIEHVDAPVALLKFCQRHLAPDGRILVATPNPMFFPHLVEALKNEMFIPNAEHVAWISPTMALELAHRAGLRLVTYHHTQGDGKTFKRRIAVQLLKTFGLRENELFSGCFYYIFAAA